MGSLLLHGLFSGCRERGDSLAAVHWLLPAVASLVAEPAPELSGCCRGLNPCSSRLWSPGSVLVASGLLSASSVSAAPASGAQAQSLWLPGSRSQAQSMRLPGSRAQAQSVRLPGSRAQAQSLCCRGLAALRCVGSCGSGVGPESLALAG